MRAAETKTAKPCVVVFFEHAGSAMMSYSTGRWSSHLNDFNIDEEVFLLIVVRCRLQSVGVDREMKIKDGFRNLQSMIVVTGCGACR
ncbi:TPA: hypothetical protein QDC27_000774 [Burkholderia cepacia ATCC 25416]|uniref:hypothetical protein n=1 Tax=Burkholderia cepacia TaxID=292 RepID=UPI000F55A37D|nr:hypothetical protein [Burkholderia cepacia]HDR9765565.1 hypothetical protein [Burkholderia cepacia ATCC 25416]MCA8077676.1 hypothetical protein [Burkholderia cepacia]HDR9773054.1 hypothetical protein [Burkholderia cepacia ATCC 25416]HDR9781794.1 hypothetical protein [Burkholderia cepacia ATCC 25416]HDR9791425.1 hypothetical protein [Burkholderia cepacia ATCC 25416]